MTEDFDIGKNLEILDRFLTDGLNRSGLGGYVVGLSGGIDSALSAALAVRAIGPAKVLGIMMPYRTSSAASLTDAERLVAVLSIESRKVDISPMIDPYFPTINEDMRLRAGNMMARVRMATLFDIAAETGRLVLGAGNRTEICLGYTTWYGDSACSLNPIGQLYKSEVRLLSRELGVPASILTKAPSADLWAGQTDEGEIGVTYEEIDRLLRRIIDDGETSQSQLVSDGFRVEDIDRVVALVNRNSFKRSLPDVAELGKKPIPAIIALTDQA